MVRDICYVRYSNGYTAIYRHLSGFVNPIADAIEAYQYEKESWEVDLILQQHNIPCMPVSKLHGAEIRAILWDRIFTWT